MTPRPGDLVAIPFPYTDLSATKRRPVLVLTSADKRGDFMSLAVTSVPTPEQALAIDATDMAVGKLPQSSWIRCDKVFTLNKASVAKTYGRLQNGTFTEVLNCFCTYVGCA